MEKDYLFLEERQSLLYLMFMKEKFIYIDYVFKGFLSDVVAQKKQELKLKGLPIVYFGVPTVRQLPNKGNDEIDFMEMKSILVHHKKTKYNPIEKEKALKDLHIKEIRAKGSSADFLGISNRIKVYYWKITTPEPIDLKKNLNY